MGPVAKRLFGISIVYLFVLFAALLVERALGLQHFGIPFGQRVGMSLVMDQQPTEPGIVLTAEQKRRRRGRSIAIALALAVFVALIFAVTLVKGPGVMIRPL